MKTTKAKKGFTLVELLVVIAILAILSTATIVGYSVYIRTAEKSNAQTLAGQFNALLKTDLKKHADMAAAISALDGAGVDFFDEISGEEKFLFAYDAERDEFIPLDEDGKQFSGEELSGADIWLAAETSEKAEEYGKICSVYLSKTYAASGKISLSYGYDAGETGGEAAVNIENDGVADIICRSGGNEKITIKTPNATVHYYGDEENLDITNSSFKKIIYNSAAVSEDDTGSDDDNKTDDNTDDDTDKTKDDEEPAKQTALYTRCDEDGNADESGDYMLFGRYPQTDVTETEGASLTETYAGNLPVEGESANASWWKSYGFYANGEIVHYSWYKDVDADGDGAYDYRGVYFTSYRPPFTKDKYSTVEDARQYKFGYKTATIYWFKYEPILWKILLEEDGEYTLFCEDIISCGQFSAVAVSDYTESDVYEFLNGDFVSYAFSSEELAIIAENDGAKAPYLLSLTDAKSFTKDEQKKKVSDYTKCLGIYADENGFGYWWTNTVENSSAAYYITSTSGEYASEVTYSEVGIVPAIKIAATE